METLLQLVTDIPASFFLTCLEGHLGALQDEGQECLAEIWTGVK